MKENFASSTFSDFYDVKELYRSQSGAVYRATFKYNRAVYVLKERKIPELGKKKDIMNEFKLLMQLDHPNVLCCEGWFRDEVRLQPSAAVDSHNYLPHTPHTHRLEIPSS